MKDCLFGIGENIWRSKNARNYYSGKDQEIKAIDNVSSEALFDNENDGTTK